MKKRFLLTALMLPIVLLGALAGWVVWYADQPLTVRDGRVEAVAVVVFADVAVDVQRGVVLGGQ